jgi:thymidylate synthase
MLKRCYSQKYRENAPTYKDVFVHNRWHSFENFLRDVRYLPQYFLAREDKFEDWQLDKDYYGSNAYSAETCVFLKRRENVTYARSDCFYKITDKDGNVSYDLTIAGFAETANLNLKRLRRAINEGKTYNGFTIEKQPQEKDFVFRYELSRNQLVSLLKGLVKDPYSRRHIISFWHWANIDKKSLVECAYETMWNVSNDGNGKEYLNVTLVQRSGDSLTASCAGVNECQYSALLMMVAKHCGYHVGKLYHLVVNEQIYDHHIDQAKEMIRRYEERLEHEKKDDAESKDGVYPNLILDTDKTDFFEFTIDDFKLVNYDPMKPQLTLDLGI